MKELYPRRRQNNLEAIRECDISIPALISVVSKSKDAGGGQGHDETCCGGTGRRANMDTGALLAPFLPQPCLTAKFALLLRLFLC